MLQIISHSFALFYSVFHVVSHCFTLFHTVSLLWEKSGKSGARNS